MGWLKSGLFAKVVRLSSSTVMAKHFVKMIYLSPHHPFIPQANKKVDLSALIPAMEGNDGVVPPMYQEMEDAIKCVRAEGIKTALLTNNWLTEKSKGYSPVDHSLFDVVSFQNNTESENSLL